MASTATATMTNGSTNHDPLPPPAPVAKKAKTKKALNSEDNAKLIQARLAQLEQERAGEKTQQAELDKEVKKESRQVDEELGKFKSDQDRANALQKKYESVFADMKKLEREFAKQKKKSDQLQKEKDKITGEHNKVNSQKDKMEKLSRTFQQENRKLKDDNKKLEDTERYAREAVNDRLDDILDDLAEVMNARPPSHSENLAMELDDVYVRSSGVYVLD